MEMAVAAETRSARGTGGIMAEGSNGTSKGHASRVAVFGYGPEAREQATRLRTIGWSVDVVVRLGGMSWIRAVDDGFRPVSAAEAAARANIVLMHLPERELPAVWAYGIAPYLAPGSLAVFAHGYALHSGAVAPDPRLDVVLLTGCEPGEGAERACRVAVHRDATGHALERVAAFARAVYAAPKIGTTTIDSETRADLSTLVSKRGGLAAFLAELDRVLANPSHEPDEATLNYYERLRASVLAGRQPAETMSPPKSHVELSRTRGSRKRGAA
jgi:ketol-acid reductoisomerase